MLLPKILAVWLAALIPLVSLQGLQYPIHDNGLNKVVRWDHYSLIINGERLVVWSGEFHYWRIPVPGLWLDIMQKVKAAGWNTIAIYANWWYHNPAPGVLNFEHGAHDPEILFEYAKQVGLYVLWRSGPYINAEANAGGFPGWVTTGAYGSLRNNDSRYEDAWYPYMAETTRIAAKYQVTNGGPVVLVQLENEFAEQWTDPIRKIPYWPANEYMEQLEECIRENGLDIPTITNAPNVNGRSWSKDYSNLTSNQDIYGLDSYPQCWSCDVEKECGSGGSFNTFTVLNYRDHFSIVSPTQPSFLPEFQGGNYNPWGGNYETCSETTGESFVNIFYRDNLAQRVTMHSVYMTYGGTNWGGIAWDTVGTSYDYSAPIQESRFVGEKYHESRIIALQVRSLPGLTKTRLVGNTTDYSDSNFVLATELQNLDTESRFYVVRHEPSNRTETDNYRLKISTKSGNITVPQSFDSLTLKGRESKIMATDYDLTGGRKLVYSTAEILSFSTVDEDKPLLVLWGTTGVQNEIMLSGVGGEGTVHRGQVSQQANRGGNSTTVLSFTHDESLSSVVTFTDGLRILILDRRAAASFYEPSLSPDPMFGTKDALAVTGAYLVRDASEQDGTLALIGDLAGETDLEVFPGSSTTTITWNGEQIDAEKTDYGSFTAKLNPTIPEFSSPSLSNWRVTDNIPEISTDYDDSLWTAAANSTTPNIYKPETLPVLWAEDANLFWGPILWRGYFASPSSNTTAPTSVSLKVQGGAAFAYAAYLNGQFVGSWEGAKYMSVHNDTFSFRNASLTPAGESNVLFVIQDMTGKGLRADALIPRGIINATLTGSNGQSIPAGKAADGSNRNGGFDEWRVTGTAGQGTHARNPLLDPIRGPLAEGGWHHERLGWHLPGFEVPTSWETLEGSTLSVAGVGAQYFYTTFPLDVPQGIDALLAFRLTDTGKASNFRVWIYINGYQYGRMYANVGTQTVFPVPPGILDLKGDNTLGVVLWALDEGGAEVGISLEADPGLLATSLDTRSMGEDIRTGGGCEERMQYY